MIGESAAFTDPFYSPGSDFIAIESDMVVDMIDREIKGEDIAERGRLYDEFVAWRFEVTLLLYADLYKTFGSYELFREKCYFDCASYYNLWVDGYMKDEHLDTKALKYNLRRKGYVLEAMKNFNRLFGGAADEMMAKGTYWRGNLGNDVLNGVHAFGVFEGLGKPRSHRDINERTEMIFNEARRGVVRLLADESVEPYCRGPAPARDVMPGMVSRGDLMLEDFMGDVDLRHAQSSRDMAPPAAE